MFPIAGQLKCTTRLIWSLCSPTDTAVSDIEEAFRSFSTRPEIAIILINQNVRGRQVGGRREGGRGGSEGGREGGRQGREVNLTDSLVHVV